MRWYTGFLLFAVLLICVPVRAAVFITGKVVDAETQKPLPGASVSLLKGGIPDFAANHPPAISTGQSLANGSFILRAPGPGAYVISVAVVKGYELLEKKITLTPAGLKNLTLNLVPQPTLRVRILGVDGKPAAKQQFEFQIQITQAHGSTGQGQGETTNAAGIVEFPEIESGSMQDITGVSIFVHSETLGGAYLQLDGWPRKPVDLTLQPPLDISGTLVDEAGKGIAKTTVNAFWFFQLGEWPELRSLAQVETDADGHFKLSGLFPGSYFIWSHPAHLPGRGQIVKLSHDSVTITLRPGDHV